MMSKIINAMERGWLPDPLIRFGIRRLCKQRLASLGEASDEKTRRYADKISQGPVAAHTREANEQHYELPPTFFERVLGKNLKYSSGFWPEGCHGIDESERAALEETCKRAELKDGQRILELGCGWGSLTLTMARKFPNASIIALSNSAPQRLFIEARAKNEGLSNIQIITRDISTLPPLEKEYEPFDRVVSVEMFEHMENYKILLERISAWLKPEGKLFVHIFTHRVHSYPFETEGDDNWLGKYFFTGGQMPAHALLGQFQNHLHLEKTWLWDGMHYSKTSRAWLENMDKHREEIITIFADVYGPALANRWVERWRIFFMACEELFGYQKGQQWGVSHYLFKNRRVS